MIVSINQPAYLPWLGYFDRIARSDLHIVLDHVQMERHASTSFTNRNRVRTAQGWTWLTVPVRRAADAQEARIMNALTEGDRWAGKHWQTLRHAYGRAPFFARHAEWFEAFYAAPEGRLAPMLKSSTNHLLAQLGIGTPVLDSSRMKAEGSKADLVLNLCKEVGATTYLSGPFGRDYLDGEAFAQAGIEVRYHDYDHPCYDQMHPGFEPYMSVVDLLFNHGPRSLSILKGAA